MTDALKISVVVATYCSGPGLDRLVASLDAQSLPSDEWEVIFVDDGSPDDTWDRLLTIRSQRSNVRLERIRNSGWPCRPRNIGTELARGEYIAYMDHDDQLYPDALRDGYAFAKKHGSDVVNGKEARTHDPGWAVDLYRKDEGQVLERTDIHPLIPTNPHKLYRRDFLNEHGIRFREGGRVLWEDVFFNVLVGRHAKVISTMASTPYYHWCATPGSGSTTFLRSRGEWWLWLEEMVAAISSDLEGERLATQRRLLLQHQYRSRLLDSFNNLYARRPATERKLIFENARRIQATYFPEELDQCLNRTQQMRAQLLRRGYAHLLERLTVDDPNVPGRTAITHAQWLDGVLYLVARGDWVDDTGGRHRFDVRDGRFYKALDPRYATEFTPELFDMTEDLRSATLTIGVRSVSSRITWMAEGQSRAWLDPTRPDAMWGVNAEAHLDPATAALGKPLSRGVWELNGRCTLAGITNHRMARASSLQPAVHIDEHGTAAVYARRDGVVVLDFDQTETPLSHFVTVSGLRSEDDTIVVEISGLPTNQDAVIPTTVDIDRRPFATRLFAATRGWVTSALRRKTQQSRRWEQIPAILRISDEIATLEFTVPRGGAISVRLGHRLPGGPHHYRRTSNQRVLRKENALSTRLP